MRVETSAALKLGKSKKGGTRQEQKGRKGEEEAQLYMGVVLILILGEFILCLCSDGILVGIFCGDCFIYFICVMLILFSWKMVLFFYFPKMVLFLFRGNLFYVKVYVDFNVN